MKIFLLCLLSLILSSCSFNKAEVDIWNLSTPSVDTLSHDFGTMDVGAKVQDKIFIFSKAPGATENASTNVFLDSGDFLVVTATGCNRELKKAADKCHVKVRFLKNKVEGHYSASLFVGESLENATEVLLTATVGSPVVSATEVLSLKEGASILPWSESLSFGELPKNTTLTKTLTLSNEGLMEVKDVVINLQGSSYTKTTDTCSGKNLGQKKSCYVKIQVKTTNQDSGEISGELPVEASNLVSQQVLLTTTVAEPAPPVASDLKFYEGSVEVVSVLNFGLLQGLGASISKVLVLKNEGSSAMELNPEILGSTAFRISSSTCPEVLGVNKTCYLRMAMLSLSPNVGPQEGELKVGASTLALQGEIIPPGIITTYVPIFSGYGSCSASTVCSGTGEETRTLLACAKLENSVFVDFTDEEHCVNGGPLELSRTCNSPSGEFEVAIPNGIETKFCASGSTTAEFVSRTCLGDAEDVDGACVITTIPPTWEIGTLNVLGTTIKAPERTRLATVTKLSSVSSVSVGVSNSSAVSSSPKDSLVGFDTPTMEFSPSPVLKHSSSGGYYSYDLISNFIFDLPTILNALVDKLFSHVNFPGVSVPVKEVITTQLTNITLSGHDMGDRNSTKALNGKMYFAGRDSSNRTRLMEYDPASERVYVVAEINVSASDNPIYLTAIGTNLYFIADVATNQRKLFRFNPSNNTVVQIVNLQNGASDFTIPAYTSTPLILAHDGRLVFPGNYSGSNSRLYTYSPSNGVITRISSAHATNDAPNNLISLGDKVYFAAANSSGFRKLYRYTPALDSVAQISNTSGSATVADVDNAFNIAVTSDRVLFRATNTESRTKLFEYNVLTGVTKQVSNTNPTGIDAPERFTVSDNVLYFSSRDSSNSLKFFKYVPETNTVSLVMNKNMLSGAADFEPYQAKHLGKFYFTSYTSGISNPALFEYDPQSNVIRQITSAPMSVRLLSSVGGKLVFAGRKDSDVGWRTYSYDPVASVVYEHVLTNNSQGSSGDSLDAPQGYTLLEETSEGVTMFMFSSDQYLGIKPFKVQIK